MDSNIHYQPIWVRGAYGPDASSVLSHLGPVENLIHQSVEKFYDFLMEIPDAKAVLDNLTPKEFEHLRLAQSEYMGSVLHPELSPESHKVMAGRAGRRHFCSGVSTDVLTEASVMYLDIAVVIADGDPNAEKLKDIITRRFQYDLINQIEMYTQVQQNRLSVHQKIVQQRQTANTLDFIQDTLEILIKSLNEDIMGVAVGSVKNGNYRHLLAKGQVPYDATDLTLPDYPTVTVPDIQQAWFREQPIIVNKLDQYPHWRTECKSMGIRSLGQFLMHDLQGAPIALLMVCESFPGYFLNESTRHYWQQIADLIGVNLDFIEKSRIKRRHRLADGLRFRRLLAQEKVEMHYQPIVDPSSGRTIKAEALGRLRDGDEIISPGKFLSAFGSNQLRDLFDIGLTRVMDDISSFSDPSLVCSINLPPEAMNDTEWLKALPEQFERLGARPDRIGLEIVESALSDEKKVQHALFTLKEAGFSILLDDVGTGESSLLRLATLPVTGIKIDQRFVRSIRENFEYLDLILSLWSLATQRGLECVAEGVENEDIVDCLGSIGGFLLQGYAYAKPMPAKAMADWILTHADNQPLHDFPRSLYGWYSLHVARCISIRNAVPTASDLLDIEQLKDSKRCFMHTLPPGVKSDGNIEKAHEKWHKDYFRFATMIQAGRNAADLWAEMETSKQELRSLVERKVRTPYLREK
ncbi:EAL domain-containing protein [Desulfosarcina ovata]|uniref:EAL domain-containing protein n=1 Tax=Desulfosarcina ovata subsp. ovata TaxID=2752305 RepID=A0A5K8ACT5_9BACT|nr:EAL domain-containing protein [Desulfosarcina ovata]BBO90298.1 hypothetical protein DSCOOX_34780 [Desulfosarcina ovata subsp. ovata]